MGSVVERDAVDTGESNTTDVGKLVTDMDRLWRQYLDNEEAKDRANAELVQQEMALRGLAESWQIIFKGSESAEYDCRKVAKQAVEAIIEHAEKVFAPEGGSLKIDDSLRHKLLGVASEAPLEELSLAGVWQRLEKAYGNGRGKEIARRQNAKALIDAFDLDREAPKCVGGKVVMSMGVWTEKGWSGSGRRLSYSSRDSVTNAVRALAAFMKNIDKEAEARYLGDLATDLARSDKVTSRECYHLGGVTVTTYYERFEFRLDAEIAKLLQVHLGTYGAPAG